MNKTFLIIPFILALSACDAQIHASANSESPDPQTLVQATPYTEILVNNTKYDIFKLPDGTECVASYRLETITCNWQKPDIAGDAQQ